MEGKRPQLRISGLTETTGPRMVHAEKRADMNAVERIIQAQERRAARLKRRFQGRTMEELYFSRQSASMSIERAKGLELRHARLRYFAVDDEIQRRRRNGEANQ